MKKVYVASRLSPWGGAVTYGCFHRHDFGPPAAKEYYAGDACGCFACNQQRARELCHSVTLAGHAPYAPHLLFTQFLDDAKPAERALGIAAGKAFLQVCDELWFDERYGISTGMKAEIELAANGFERPPFGGWKSIPVRSFSEALAEAQASAAAAYDAMQSR